MIFFITLEEKNSLPIIAFFSIVSINFIVKQIKTDEKITEDAVENFIKKIKSESDLIENENNNLKNSGEKYKKICDFYKANKSNIDKFKFNNLFVEALKEKIYKIKIFLMRFYGYYYEENGIKTILDSHKSQEALKREINGKEIKYLFPFAEKIKDDFLPALEKYQNKNNNDFFKLFDFIVNSISDFNENLKDFKEKINNSQLLITHREDLDEKRRDSLATKYFFLIKSRCNSGVFLWGLNNSEFYNYLSRTKKSALKENKNIKLFYSNTAFLIDNNTLKEAFDYMANSCKTNKKIEEKMSELKKFVNKNISNDSDAIIKEINELKYLFKMRSDIM